jgi:hypothetical protein
MSETNFWQRLTALVVVAMLMPWPLLAGPNNWWAYVLATVAIVAALRLLLGQGWADIAGLNMPLSNVFVVVGAFVVVATGSEILLPIVYRATGLNVTAPGIEEQAGFLFQAFNEEILFRALMVGFLVRYASSSFAVSIGVAFVFAVAHFILYRFSNPMHLALPITSLATLFFAGVAMNSLYLAFGHIGFSWALHGGWNVVWLSASFYDAATHVRLAEPQIFDRVLSSPILVVLAFSIAILSFLIQCGRRRQPSATHRQA